MYVATHTAGAAAGRLQAQIWAALRYDNKMIRGITE